MEGEKREHWMRLCVEAADGQDSKRLLELISEIDCLLHEREMRIRNVRREASKYVIEAAEKKASKNLWPLRNSLGPEELPFRINAVRPPLQFDSSIFS